MLERGAKRTKTGRERDAIGPGTAETFQLTLADPLVGLRDDGAPSGRGRTGRANMQGPAAVAARKKEARATRKAEKAALAPKQKWKGKARISTKRNTY